MIQQMLGTAIALTIAMSSCAQPTAETNSTAAKTIEMDTENDQKRIEALLFQYRDALNASDVDAALALYTEDGVFMPSGASTTIGQEQVRGAYEFVFSNIQLNIEFSIDEIVVEGKCAFARTTSKGTTLIHATGETVPEENRELFVLEKGDDSRKIARYMFNKMQ
ncbi:MAG: SgcJ/EcaC family oxidoreductase [Bacteroidota bacterium]